MPFELRERAVRMVLENQRLCGSQWEAICGRRSARSRRELAHRGSYEGRVWVSPSTVDRLLARHGLALQGVPRPARTLRTPWPHWCEWRPSLLWCWDGSQFGSCVAAKYAYAIVDLVSRKWISTHLTANPDSVAARVPFSRGLDNEGLLTDDHRPGRARRRTRTRPRPLQQRPAARNDQLRHPQRRTRRPRRHQPRSSRPRHANHRRTTPNPAPEPAMNPTTTLTNHNPPATIGHSLNPHPIRREEPEAPHERSATDPPSQHRPAERRTHQETPSGILMNDRG